MKNLILAFYLVGFLILAACNNENGFDPLAQPPYDKITDSIEDQPRNADLYYRRGQMLYANNQPFFAAKDIRKAWYLQSRESFALSLITILQERNLDSAIIFMEEAEKRLQGSIAIKVNLARAYYEKGEKTKALSLAETLIQQHPGQLDALVLKAEILKESDKLNEAIGVLEQAYSYAPGDVDIVHSLAFAYAEAKNSKALRLADSLIRIDVQKSHAEPYYFKGVFFSNNNQPIEAIKNFDLAIQRNYNFIQAYINKGIIYFEQKKYPEAIKTFQLASTVSPTEPGPYYWLGRTQEAMGLTEQARLDFERAYALDKTFTEAKEGAERMRKK